jgi:signal transduction histidine kinase
MPVSESHALGWQVLARLVAFTTAYALATQLGMLLAFPPEHVSAMWPPSGVALAGMLLTRHREWPALVVAAILVRPFVLHDAAWPVSALSFFISTTNLLEAVAGAFLLRRLVRFHASLARLRDALGLLGLAGLASTALGATLGVLLLLEDGSVGPADFWRTWRVFWVGDAMGVLVVAPVLLTWLSRSGTPWTLQRRAELAALLACLGVATHLVFRTPPSPDMEAFHPLVYLAFPFLLWAALRFEARGAALATALLSAVALWHTAQGRGPFAHAALDNTRLLVLQSFLAAASVCGLLLASALAERRRALEEVRHLNGELHESLRTLAATQAELVRRERMAALGELSATVAHEVRNPLGVLTNALATLRRLVPQSGQEPAGTLLGIMDEEVQRLDLIVGDLLDFARPVTPRLQAQPLVPLVEGALTAALRSGPAGLTVSRTLDEGLPPLPVDAQLLHVALSNLFSNAAQAMPSGGTLTARLEPATHAGAPHARLTISDTGPGMPPQVQARIFEPFFTTRASGTGLGLAIVRRIIDGHHGQVSVHSTVGQGTTFTVLLPYAAQAQG